MHETQTGADERQASAAHQPASQRFQVRHRVLLLGCSGRQRADPAPLPAIDRYDGPSFRVLRRYLRQPSPELPAPSVFVLSAEHGVIPGSLPIRPYNRTMTTERAQELAAQVGRQFARLAGADTTGVDTTGADTTGAGVPGTADLLVSCTRAYLPALAALSDALPAGSTVQTAPLRPGERLACLHDWLYGHPPLLGRAAGPPPSRDPDRRPAMVPGLHLRGVEIVLTAQELLARAQAALAAQDPATRVPAMQVVQLGGSDLRVSEESPLPQTLPGANIGFADIIPRARERGACLPSPAHGGGAGGGGFLLSTNFGPAGQLAACPARLPAAHAPTTWAVDVGGVAVSPKWLVSLASGLSRSAFGTSDALRVLAALGITAHRVTE